MASAHSLKKFIDPGECDFQDPHDARFVNLDEVCRMQRIHDGVFDQLADVPARALSLTIPFFLRTPHAVVSVPGESKRQAVLAAMTGPIEESCPASMLRRHPNATLFLDCEAAGRRASI
jgi:glucosamine-6-phosphate deaminase